MPTELVSHNMKLNHNVYISCIICLDPYSVPLAKACTIQYVKEEQKENSKATMRFLRSKSKTKQSKNMQPEVNIEIYSYIVCS